MMRVDVENRQQSHIVDVDHLVELLAATLTDQHLGSAPETGGEGHGEVGLALVDIDEMTQLNEQHMGGTGPTDVLAFPIDGVEGAEVPDGQPAMLGDIVICPAVAAKAPQSLGDELALLVVHGALHLVGHDHAEPEETVVMKALEAEMLERYHPS